MNKNRRLQVSGFDISKLAFVLIALVSSISGAIIGFWQVVDSKFVSELIAKFGSLEDVIKIIFVVFSVIAVLLLVLRVLMREVEEFAISYLKLRRTIKDLKGEKDKKLHVND